MVYYTGSNNLPRPIDDNFHGQNSWPLNYNQGLYTGDTSGFGASGSVKAIGSQEASAAQNDAFKVMAMIRAFMTHGHLKADLDPLNLDYA